MKSKFVILSLIILLGTRGDVFAIEGIGQGQPASEVKALEVGNKICPVTGEKVGEMGEVVKYEYNGKIYSLCCEMCVKDFKKNPEKYSKIANEETKEIQVDPHKDHNHNNS